MDAQVCQHEGTQQPRPHGPLGVCGVAFRGRASIMPAILRVSWIERAQTVRSEQPTHANLHNSGTLVGAERALGQRHREYLVGPEGCVIAAGPILTAGPVEHIEAAVFLDIPEPRKTRL